MYRKSSGILNSCTKCSWQTNLYFIVDNLNNENDVTLKLSFNITFICNIQVGTDILAIESDEVLMSTRQSKSTIFGNETK